tara:strand:- start:27562 stop:27672 length:111 start_codon:yes stop_codon:yes gene_type:complete
MILNFFYYPIGIIDYSAKIKLEADIHKYYPIKMIGK